MTNFIEGISLFMLIEIPCEDSFLLYLNGQLRLKEDYRVTNNGLQAFVEWLNPDGLFLEHRDSLVARYRSKKREYYIEQYLLDPPIKRKTSFFSRIIRSIMNLFKKEEQI